MTVPGLGGKIKRDSLRIESTAVIHHSALTGDFRGQSFETNRDISI